MKTITKVVLLTIAFTSASVMAEPANLQTGWIKALNSETVTIASIKGQPVNKPQQGWIKAL